MQRRVGELLVAAGAVAAADLERALAQQRSRPGKRIGELLIAAGCCTAEAVARALAEQFELPFVQLPEIPSKVSALLPLEFQAEHRLVPFRLEIDGRTERIHLAMADPTRMEVVDELRFQINKPLTIYVAAADDVEGVLVALQGGDASVVIDDEDDGPPGAQAAPPKITPVIAPPAAPAPKPVAVASAPADGAEIEIPVEWVVEKPAPPAEALPPREPPTLRVLAPASGPPPPSAPIDVSAESWAAAFPPPPPRVSKPAPVQPKPALVAAPPPVAPPKPAPSGLLPGPAIELPSIIVDIVETNEPASPASLPSIAVRPPPAPPKAAPLPAPPAALPMAKAAPPPAPSAPRKPEPPPAPAPAVEPVRAPSAMRKAEPVSPTAQTVEFVASPGPTAPTVEFSAGTLALQRADPVAPPAPKVDLAAVPAAPRNGGPAPKSAAALALAELKPAQPPPAPELGSASQPATPPVGTPLTFSAPTPAEDSLEGSWFAEAPATDASVAPDAELEKALAEPQPVTAPPHAAANGAAVAPAKDSQAGVERDAPQASKENGKIEFSDSDLDVLEALEHLAAGEAPAVESEKVKPPQMVASLIRLLIRKGVIDELEFLEELGRK